MTGIFTWNDEYSIGHETIDAQHARLFELANAVLAIENASQHAERIKEAVRSLYQYVEIHFNHEEALMRIVGYPELNHHAELHKQLIEKMNTLLLMSKTFDEFVPALQKHMSDWVLRHIIEQDQMIGAYMRSLHQSDMNAETHVK